MERLDNCAPFDVETLASEIRMRTFVAPFPIDASLELQDELFAMSLYLDMMRRKPEQSDNWVSQFERSYNRVQSILDGLKA